MISLYCNLDIDDWKFDRLLTSMATLQVEYVHASFLFVGDLNGHHQDWLGFTTTNHHGVAEFEFMTVWFVSVGCYPPKHVVELLTS